MSNHNYPINPSLINAWSTRLSEQVPSCPCPPETVDPSLDTVDGGIFISSTPVCECGSTFYRDDLGSCYDCFFPSDDRGE